MKYKGIDLKELDIRNIEPVTYNPPRKMLVWDDNYKVPDEEDVLAILPTRESGYQVVTHRLAYGHCAEIPNAKPVTNRELARWLSADNGEVMDSDYVTTTWFYWLRQADATIKQSLVVRKWNETEWHSPTREYLGLEDK